MELEYSWNSACNPLAHPHLHQASERLPQEDQPTYFPTRASILHDSASYCLLSPGLLLKAVQKLYLKKHLNTQCKAGLASPGLNIFSLVNCIRSSPEQGTGEMENLRAPAAARLADFLARLTTADRTNMERYSPTGTQTSSPCFALCPQPRQAKRVNGVLCVHSGLEWLELICRSPYNFWAMHKNLEVPSSIFFSLSWNRQRFI